MNAETLEEFVCRWLREHSPGVVGFVELAHAVQERTAVEAFKAECNMCADEMPMAGENTHVYNGQKYTCKAWRIRNRFNLKEGV